MALQNDKLLSFTEFKRLKLLDYGTDASQRRIRRDVLEILVSVTSARESLPETLIWNDVELMPRRTQQCIRNRGVHTGY